MYPNMHSCVVRFKRVKCRKSTKEFSYMALPYKIFNFLVMWIELDVFIRKFIKRIKISANIRNFTKGIEISVNIRSFTKWIETSVNIRTFTSWIDTWREKSVWVFEILQNGLKSVWNFEILQSELKSVWMFEILQSGFKSAVRGGSNIALTTTTKKVQMTHALFVVGIMAAALLFYSNLFSSCVCTDVRMSAFVGTDR